MKGVLRVMMETPREIGNGRQEGTSEAMARLRKALIEFSIILGNIPRAAGREVFQEFLRGISGNPKETQRVQLCIF